MSGDAQAGAGDRFAVLVVQVGRYGLDGFAVQSGAGEIGQADFVAAYFQIVGGALSQCLADLDLQLFLFSLCGLDQLGGFLVLLDKHYFAGKLPEPIISLKKTPSAYGHITCSKVWQAGGENKYEINISSATLDRPIEETASTLLHEMVHEYCMETGIKDTSNNGVYHNRRFKEQAEAHGLTVDHHEKYGWTITSPSEELLDFIIFQGWQDIQMGERLAWSDMAGTGAGSKAPGSSQTGAPKPPKAKSSTRRWVCPKCGTIIRSTKEVRVICADCMELFVKAD